MQNKAILNDMVSREYEKIRMERDNEIRKQNY